MDYLPAISFDSETHLLAMCNLVPKLVCLSACMKDGDTYETALGVAAEKPELDGLIDLVTKKDAYHRVAHNTPFDLAVLCGARPDLIPAIFQGLEEGLFEDTLIREKLLHLSSHGDLEFMTVGDSQQPIKYGLNDLTKRYLAIDRSEEKSGNDAWRTNYSILEALPVAQWPKDAVEYVKDDSECCLRIREIQEGYRKQIFESCGHDPFATQDFQVAVAFALYLISARGLAVDMEKRNAIAADLAEELKPERMQRLVAAGILRKGSPPAPYANKAKNPDGTLKMKAAVEESIDKKALVAYMQQWAKSQKPPVELARLPVTEAAAAKGATEGNIETGIDFFKDKLDDPIFAEYHHRASLQKLVTTELPRISGEVVHPCFNVLVSSGRTSSYASKIYPSFNCQNVHPKVRECFIPRPGMVMFSIDYSGMELGTLAQKLFNLFGKSAHKDMINAGIDNHTYLGAQLAYALDTNFKASCDAVGVSSAMDVYAAFLKCKSHPDEAVKKLFAHYRKFAKPTGLGYPGGLGPKTFIDYAKATYGITVDLDTATRLRDIWHNTYPEMKPYFDWVNNACKDPINEDKYAYSTPFGMYVAGTSYCGCANGAALQAFSAEGAKLAVFNVVRACYDPSRNSPLYGKCFPLAFVHDEVLGEVPEAEAHELVIEVQKIMEESFAQVTPDVAVKAVGCLQKRWNKLAEPVFDKNGRLVPWEPKEIKK